jgi:DNA-binding CsgD family transcriptional regulator
VPGAIRVFVGGATAAERRALVDRISGDARWIVVGDPDRADIVVLSPEEWTRLKALDQPRSNRGVDRPVESLTTREREVLVLVADGLHNREIAARLGVSEHTVKFHLGAVFGKLGASTRTEAVQKGIRLGIVEI